MVIDIFDAMGVLVSAAGVWILILRLVLSAIAGFAIGCERRYRLKDAGIKTHTIMCVTACLLMIISKYGFYELSKFEGISYDTSRVASNIATGLCFIGSGMLLYKKDNIKGLTTAVGMCLTMAIGMSFGAGLIITGTFVTIFTIILQLILHLPFSFFKNKDAIIVRAQFIVNGNYIDHFKEKFNISKFIKFKTFVDNDDLIAEVEFIYTDKIHSEELIDMIKDEKEILMFEKIEEN